MPLLFLLFVKLSRVCDRCCRCRHSQHCVNSEWNSETVWELRPQHALHSKGRVGAHLRQHFADLIAARKLLEPDVVTDRVVAKARSKIDAWQLAAGSSSKGALEFHRRPHSEHRKAERLLQVELEVLAKQEKVAAEQEKLRAAAEVKKSKPKPKPKPKNDHVFVGWGKG